MRKRPFNGPPSPEEFQRQLQDFIRQHLAGGAMPKTDPAGTPETPPPAPPQQEFAFDKTPRQVKAYLDRFVIKQEEAKKVLSVALCDHYHHIRMAREGGGRHTITPSKTSF
jgi:ATP-dependent protease Clp ATPase subunit